MSSYYPRQGLNITLGPLGKSVPFCVSSYPVGSNMWLREFKHGISSLFVTVVDPQSYSFSD